jgi:hypothetical protein
MTIIGHFKSFSFIVSTLLSTLGCIKGDCRMAENVFSASCSILHKKIRHGAEAPLHVS